MFDDVLQKELLEIQKKNRFRKCLPPIGIDFSSNDYLGLSDHPKLKEAFIKGTSIYGLGSTASRLIRGHRDVFSELEEEFSKWVGSEDCLFVNNGFVANLGLIDSICDKSTILFSDRLNHASILDGIRLAGSTCRYYKHCNYEHLEELLQLYPESSRKIILSETLFSMDGDICNVEKLVELKNKYNCVLVLDEAHALGVLGKEGSGVSYQYAKEIEFRVYTGGKSLGLHGAMIACSKTAKEYLVNVMRPFIFSTAPMPSLAYALLQSIQLARSMESERKTLLENSNYFRNTLNAKGYITLNSVAQIVPVILYTEEKSLQIAKQLQEKGFDIRAIRPPTVKESRLRISINAKRTRDEIDSILKYL